ncbi:MAG TPA: HDOD domain-containing protein [Tepidisphaeraceae bacterium]|jgi:putative nucleotidyltransferase with HDIG domain
MTEFLADAWNWVAERIQSLLGRKPKRRARMSQSMGDDAHDDLLPAAPFDGAPPLGSRFRPRSTGYSLSFAQMEDVNRGLQQIPPLPQGALQVMRELDSDNASAASVAQVIAREPVMAASVLRIANSAALGLRREIANVSEAVAYLGFSTTKSLFLRLKMNTLMPKPRPGRGYDNDKLWIHAMAVAQAAEEIARRAGGGDPQLALTAGLLHDIGKLAINSRQDAAINELWPANPDPAETIIDRERRLFGADHAFIGAALATEWKLPNDLIEIIRLHHLPINEPINLAPLARRALLSVYLANQLVKYRHVYCSNMEIDEVPDSVTTELGLPNWIALLQDQRITGIIDRAVLLNGGAAPDAAEAA